MGWVSMTRFSARTSRGGGLRQAGVGRWAQGRVCDHKAREHRRPRGWPSCMAGPPTPGVEMPACCAQRLVATRTSVMRLWGTKSSTRAAGACREEEVRQAGQVNSFLRIEAAGADRCHESQAALGMTAGGGATSPTEGVEAQGWTAQLTRTGPLQ